MPPSEPAGGRVSVHRAAMCQAGPGTPPWFHLEGRVDRLSQGGGAEPQKAEKGLLLWVLGENDVESSLAVCILIIS